MIFWGGQKIFRKNHASQDGQICNFSSGQARDMVLVTNTRFLGMGNHLEPFSEASDLPEDQEWDVGGPELLQGGNF